MARKNQLVQLNTFVGGLVTEASPLTFPENSSLDEVNFELLRNGSRRRRLGFDLEQGYSAQSTTSRLPSNNNLALRWHLWKNVGGVAGREYLVFQVGGTISIYDAGISPLSDGLIDSFSTDAADDDLMSFADVDGHLVCAGGLNIVRFTYDADDDNIYRTSISLKIRDVFGIQASGSGVSDYGEGEYVSRRPPTSATEHLYNLRNQGWGIPRLRSDNSSTNDPVSFFAEVLGTSTYPSNADTVIQSLYPNPDLSSDRVARRFMPRDLINNPVGGNTHAPKGYFIINALARGRYRNLRYRDLHSGSEYPVLDWVSVDFPEDRTPGSAKCVATYSGRIFYAGFSGEVIGGDSRSPNMSSYVLFSQLVNTVQDLGKCYQEGDPTSDESPELLDTDGGFIKLGDAYGISSMVNIGKGLLVLAANGVWYITGGNDYGFTATSYLVNKVTEHGCVSPRSVVLVDGTVMYWSDDGIYHIKPNQYGDLEATNISAQNIQTLYSDIDSELKLKVSGVYDSYEKKVRWLYDNEAFQARTVKELILDVTLGAFYQFEIARCVDVYRRPLMPFEVPPYSLSTVQDSVYYLSDQVTNGSDNVYVDSQTRISGLREVMYLVIMNNDTSGNIQYSFGSYNDTDFYDWGQTTSPVDAEAYLYTGYMSGGEFMLNKQVPYITFYFERTETGFDTEGSDLVARNASSCKVRALWEWSDDINSGRWGQEFQAYRYNRHYIPATSGSSYDYGQSVIVTKNKLRGKGRVLSLYIKTEPGKDCRLLGWSMMVSVDGNV